VQCCLPAQWLAAAAVTRLRRSVQKPVGRTLVAKSGYLALPTDDERRVDRRRCQTLVAGFEWATFGAFEPPLRSRSAPEQQECGSDSATYGPPSRQVRSHLRNLAQVASSMLVGKCAPDRTSIDT